MKFENRQLESDFIGEKKFICLDEHDDVDDTESQRGRDKNQYKFMDDLRINISDSEDQRTISLALLLKRNRSKAIEMYKM